MEDRNIKYSYANYLRRNRRLSIIKYFSSHFLTDHDIAYGISAGRLSSTCRAGRRDCSDSVSDYDCPIPFSDTNQSNPNNAWLYNGKHNGG